MSEFSTKLYELLEVSKLPVEKVYEIVENYRICVEICSFARA